MRVLSGDIGGTKTRLAVYEVDGAECHAEAEATYPSGDFASVAEILHGFLAEHDPGTEYLALGVAGPVKEGRCKATNLPWIVDATELRERFGFAWVGLINDLEANAWGIRALSPRDLHSLNPDAEDTEGNACVIAAGTGLGEAGLYWDGAEHHPFASEGGHADFSPGNVLETALLEYLAERYGHVSWERVLSGPGLVNVYNFLRHHRRASPPAWLVDAMGSGDPAAEISRAGLSGSDALCVEALDLFVRLYGVEAGNQALKIMATGGVYLGGGIAPKILERLEGETFLHAFRGKGRMEPLLGAMPVHVILNDRTALYGPAVFAARRGRR